MQWLIVRTGGRDLALDVRRVREIVAAVPVTRVPLAPLAVRGIAPIRGEPVPVLDLAARLGCDHASSAERSPLVVARARLRGADTTVALLVEGVERLVPADEILPRPALLDGSAGPALCAGFVRVDAILLPILDLEAVVAPGSAMGPRPLPARRATAAGRDARAAQAALEPTSTRATPNPTATATANPTVIVTATATATVIPTPIAAAAPSATATTNPTPFAITTAAATANARAVTNPTATPSAATIAAATAAPAPTPARLAKVTPTAARSSAPRSPLASAPELPSSPTSRIAPFAFAAVLAAVVLAAVVLALPRRAPLAPSTASARSPIAGAADRVAPAPGRPPVPARPSATPGAAASASASSGPASDCPVHEVRRGDTLWALAARRLGDPYRWPEIFAGNRGVLSDPDRLLPGMRLRACGAPRTSPDARL